MARKPQGWFSGAPTFEEPERRSATGSVEVILEGTVTKGEEWGGMNNRQRLKVEAAARARHFLQEHRLGVPSADAVIDRFSAKTTDAEQLMVQQDAGLTVVSATAGMRQALRDRIRREHLTHLARVADAASAVDQDLKEQCRLSKAGSERAFLVMATRSLEAARRGEALLTAHGLLPNTLDELTALLGDYQKLLEDSDAGRRVHTSATAQLRALSTDLIKMMKQIEGLMVFKFRGDPAFKAAWKSARNVKWPLVEKGVVAEKEDPKAS